MKRIASLTGLSLVTLAACTTAEQPPIEGCPAPSGPTIHEDAVITADQTWTAEGSPHIVEYDMEVTEGAKLTLEPCAEVQFAADRVLRVAYTGETSQGALIAEGTADRPITIHGKDGARWTGIVIKAPGAATLRHVTIADAGSATSSPGFGSLMILGDGQLPVKRTVLVDHVTVKDSATYGVDVHRLAGFADGSTDLVITGSGKEGAPYPLRITEHALDSLPVGTYTGNARDEIHLLNEGATMAASGLQSDATMHDRGVPYVFGEDGVEDDTLIVGGTVDGSVAKLTIEPGVTLRFRKGTMLAVELFTSEEPATGILDAVGTPEKPIIFTSAEDTPAPGDWRGIWYGGVAREGNRIEHARIEYAGAETNAIFHTCNEPAIHTGGVILGQPVQTQFIEHTTFAHIDGHGIFRGWRGPIGPDFAETNTFEDIAYCDVSWPPGPNLECPDPAPVCP